MAKLTDLQLVLLSAAAQRDGGALLPLPKRLKIEPGALTRVLKGLLKKKLVAEQAAPPDAPAWREADDRRFMLVVTPAGLDAIGVESGASKPATDGEPDAGDPDAGQFSIVDPRLARCCRVQEGCLTNSLYTSMTPGTLLMFPASVVHAVNPYRGKRPRITIAWNINETAIEGSPFPGTIGPGAA